MFLKARKMISGKQTTNKCRLTAFQRRLNWPLQQLKNEIAGQHEAVLRVDSCHSYLLPGHHITTRRCSSVIRLICSTAITVSHIQIPPKFHTSRQISVKKNQKPVARDAKT